MSPAPKMAESPADETDDSESDAEDDVVEVDGDFEADPQDQADVVDPEELPVDDAPEADSAGAEAEAVVEEGGESEEPVVDPSEIDTVDLDPFSKSVDNRLDELSAATEVAAEESASEPEPEIDIGNTELGEPGDDDASSGPFAADEEPTFSSGGSSTDAGGSDPGPFGDVSSQGDDELDQIIIEGFARAAVIKIEPKSEQSKLQDEFEEVFESFRLGYFGREVIYEYLVIDEQDNIDPIWGFFGSVLMCLVVVMWMRPDSDEITSKATESLSDLIDGVRN